MLWVCGGRMAAVVVVDLEIGWRRGRGLDPRPSWGTELPALNRVP